MDEKRSQLGIGIRKSNTIWFKQANLRKYGVKMLDNTSVLSPLLPCLLQKFALFKLLTLYAEKLLYFCFWRARTTIQKDDDFSITGHVVFGSRMPNRKTAIRTDKHVGLPLRNQIIHNIHPVGAPPCGRPKRYRI